MLESQGKPWENEPDYEYFTFAGVECVVANKFGVTWRVIKLIKDGISYKDVD
jgi:hypothetical protein